MVSRDPGLQPERTRLAWRRTVLAMSVVALLTARLALSRGATGALVAAAAGLGWLGVVGFRFSRSAGTHRRRPEGGGRALPLIALATAGYASLGVILTVTGCVRGYYTSGGAEGVGRATTNAVVSASLISLLSDFFLTKILF
jgi:hypothetical protein